MAGKMIDATLMARFLSSPDAADIVANLDALQPHVRAAWVSHLTLLVSMSSDTPSGFVSDSPEGRVVERRLREEKISDIMQAEGLSRERVKSILRQAQNQGLNVTITDPEERGTPKKAPPRAKRRTHSKEVRDYMFAQRMAGHPPAVIVQMIKRDMDYEATPFLVNKLVSDQRIHYHIDQLPPLSQESLKLSSQATKGKLTDLPPAAPTPWRPKPPPDENLIHLPERRFEPSV